MRFSLVCALIVALAGATEAARPPRITDAGLDRVGVRRVRVPGGRVREQGGAWQGGGAYVDPNEQSDGYGDALQGVASKGSLIVVGSLRAVHAGVQAVRGLDAIPRDFHVYQVDVDGITSRFNLVHRDVLADEPTRAGHAERILLKGRRLDPRLRGLGRASKGVSGWQVRQPTPTFVDDDGDYALAHALAKGGHLVPIAGSIGGRTMRDLSRSLARARAPVAGVDISNVVEFLYGDDLQNFVEALRTMPRAPGAQLLFTVRGSRIAGRAPIRVDGYPTWAFFKLPIDDVIARADRGELRSGHELIRLGIQQLLENPNPRLTSGRPEVWR